MSFEQGLLNDARKVDLVAQARCDFEPGQQSKVGAEPLEIVDLERAARRLGRKSCRRRHETILQRACGLVVGDLGIEARLAQQPCQMGPKEARIDIRRLTV